MQMCHDKAGVDTRKAKPNDACVSDTMLKATAHHQTVSVRAIARRENRTGRPERVGRLCKNN